jgi:hypothetical protein
MRRRIPGALVAAVLAACGDGGPPVGAPAPFETGAEPAALAGVASEPVVGFTGPGGAPFEVAVRAPGGARHLVRRFGTRDLPLPLRADLVGRTQEPCSSCHQGTVTRARDPDVHQNVAATHPPGIATTCFACHQAAAVDRLTLLTAETTTFEHAYRLCAQCHYAQVDAWALGYHGKRLEGWRGRRVVMGCADCHDPHGPTVTPRIPFPGPRFPEERGLLPGGAARPEQSELPFRLPPGVGEGR